MVEENPPSDGSRRAVDLNALDTFIEMVEENPPSDGSRRADLNARIEFKRRIGTTPGGGTKSIWQLHCHHVLTSGHNCVIHTACNGYTLNAFEWAAAIVA